MASTPDMNNHPWCRSDAPFSIITGYISCSDCGLPIQLAQKYKPDDLAENACPSCKGRGADNDNDVCSICNGLGISRRLEPEERLAEVFRRLDKLEEYIERVDGKVEGEAQIRMTNEERERRQALAEEEDRMMGLSP